jgi:hypothetical protein
MLSIALLFLGAFCIAASLSGSGLREKGHWHLVHMYVVTQTALPAVWIEFQGFRIIGGDRVSAGGALEGVDVLGATQLIYALCVVVQIVGVRLLRRHWRVLEQAPFPKLDGDSETRERVAAWVAVCAGTLGALALGLCIAALPLLLKLDFAEVFSNTYLFTVITNRPELQWMKLLLGAVSVVSLLSCPATVILALSRRSRLLFATAMFQLIVFGGGFSLLGSRSRVVAIVAVMLAAALLSQPGARRLRRAMLGAIGAIGLAFMVGATMVRDGESAGNGGSSTAVENVVTRVAGAGVVPILVVQSSKWPPTYGHHHLALVSALVPRNLFPQKPPVDEGMVVLNRQIGIDADYWTPSETLFASSLPPETIGNGLIALGLAGAPLYFAVWLALVTVVRARISQLKWPLFRVIGLVWLYTGFHLSNIRVVQTVMLAAGMALLWGAAWLLSRRRAPDESLARKGV